MKRILIIDDDKEICQVVSDAFLKCKDIETSIELSPVKAINALNNSKFNLIILDYKLPDFDGFEFLDKIISKILQDNIKVIMMTAYGNLKMGKKAVKRGCFDYIFKPFNIEDLVFRCHRALEEEEDSDDKEISFYENKFFIGESNEIKEVYKTVQKIAKNNVTVLFEGETGTGKEVIARMLHDLSNRRDGIFIPVNFGTFNEDVIESELFGHEKGSFTDAVIKKMGLFEIADNGTLFLDEINNMSLKVQAKLLRIIETGEFLRLGGNMVLRCNTRILAATNQSIEKLVKEGKFREDLYYRLNIVKIEIPPLKNRKDDIPLLVNYFLDYYNKKFNKKLIIDPELLNYFIKYDWPGNIRELKNLMNSIVLLNDSGRIYKKYLPNSLTRNQNKSQSFKELKRKNITKFEEAFFNKILEKTDGNITRAAKLAKMNRIFLIDKLKSAGINPDIFRSKK